DRAMLLAEDWFASWVGTCKDLTGPLAATLNSVPASTDELISFRAVRRHDRRRTDGILKINGGARHGTAHVLPLARRTCTGRLCRVTLKVRVLITGCASAQCDR